MPNTGYQIRNLNKYYGKFQALSDVSLTLPEGRIIGLLGKTGRKVHPHALHAGLLSHRGLSCWTTIPSFTIASSV